MITTLEALRDYINSNEDWQLEVNNVIEVNNWIDNTGTEYGICNDGLRSLIFNSDMEAEIVDDIAARVRIGRRIAELRSAQGLSQAQLACKAGISQTHIARVELGKYSTGIDIIDVIVRALGATITINA